MAASAAVIMVLRSIMASLALGFIGAKHSRAGEPAPLNKLLWRGLAQRNDEVGAFAGFAAVLMP